MIATKINLNNLIKHKQALEEIFYQAVDIPRDIPVSITIYQNYFLELKRFDRGLTYFLLIYPNGQIRLTKNGVKLEIDESMIREAIEKLNE